jgi:hypothetical protein
MRAGDALLPYYAIAAAAVPLALPPDGVRILDDLAPGEADARCTGVDSSGRIQIAVRADYPSPAGDPAWQETERLNTFLHELAHGLKARLRWIDASIEIDERYWRFRGFPGTAAAVHAPNAPYVWQSDPNESWAECGGAGFAGRWTKPEKTLDYGVAVDPLAARAFLVGLSRQATHHVPFAGGTYVRPFRGADGTYADIWHDPTSGLNHVIAGDIDIGQAYPGHTVRNAR